VRERRGGTPSMITPTDLQCDSPYLLMELAIVATKVLQNIRVHAEVLAKG
jgi:hypothetical protein